MSWQPGSAAEFEENPRRREKMAKLRAIEERFLR